MVGKSKSMSMFSLFNTIFMIFVMAVMLYPFIYIITLSLSPVEVINSSKFLLFPTRITLYPYEYVFKQVNIGSAYFNTIFITFFGVIFHLTITTLAAYALSNRELPGKKYISMFLIFTMMFSGGLIPFFITVKGLGLYDSLWALILPNCVSAFWIIVARNFFQGLPESIKESARIDGCTEFKIFGTIILPLSLPIVSTLALFHAVGQWNQYFNALIFISSPKKSILQVIIRAMFQSGSEQLASDALPPPVQTVRAATIMVATIPILLIYPFLQKYFVKGMMVGAVKG